MTEHVVGAWLVRTNPQRLRLEGLICPSCDKKIFPPRPICSKRYGETYIHPFKNQNGEVFSAVAITSFATEASRFSK